MNRATTSLTRTESAPAMWTSGAASRQALCVRGIAMRIRARGAESVAEARVGGRRFSDGTLDVAADRAIARGGVPRLDGSLFTATAARTHRLGPAGAARTTAQSRQIVESKRKRQGVARAKGNHRATQSSSRFHRGVGSVEMTGSHENLGPKGEASICCYQFSSKLRSVIGRISCCRGYCFLSNGSFKSAQIVEYLPRIRRS